MNRKVPGWFILLLVGMILFALLKVFWGVYQAEQRSEKEMQQHMEMLEEDSMP